MNYRDTHNAMICRVAKAIWRCEVAAGNCTTPIPITPHMSEVLMRAAAAAVAVLETPLPYPDETGD